MTIITVKTGGIAADAVTDAKIADDVVGTEHLTANEVDTAALAADAVTGAQLADDAVNSEHYTDGSIDTAHIAADQIVASLIADDAISEEHLDVTAITGHTAETSVADGDLVVVHDASASALRKMTVANLVANAGGGKIGQVISTNVSSSGMFSTTSTSYVDVTNATVTITPAASSSKIFHNLTFWQGKSALNTTWYRIINTPAGGSAAIINGTGTSENETWGGSTSGNYLNYDFATNTWNYLHTTNSTAAQVYKLQMRVDSNTSYINRVGSGTTRAATFNWTVMEVLA